jgi:hypothetical protein
VDVKNLKAGKSTMKRNAGQVKRKEFPGRATSK